MASADQKLSEKVALITGGSRGIGESIVRLFHKKGVGHVYFCDIRENNELVSADSVVFIKCDVAKEEEVRGCIEQIVKNHGRLDYLVNNAGWHPPYMPIDDFSVDDFRKLLELNTVSVFAFCKYSLPQLRATKGSIVTVSSISAHLAQPGGSTYCASKGALCSLTKALAIDEATHGVRVNSVAPTNTYTPLWAEGLKSLSADAAERLLQCGKDAQLLGRMNTPEEVAEAAWYLAEVATSTTGLELLVTGGAELNYGKKTRIGASPYDSYIELKQ